MEEKLCPKCGANVEGLLYRCDCCGASLNPSKTMFRRMVYEAGAFFDIGQYLEIIFEGLDKIPPEPYVDVLQRIEFDFWCFPIKKKTGVAYYSSRKTAIITIEVDANAYLYGTKEEKLELLTAEVREKLDMLRKRLQKKRISADDLFSRIEEALEHIAGNPFR